MRRRPRGGAAAIWAVMTLMAAFEIAKSATLTAVLVVAGFLVTCAVAFWASKTRRGVRRPRRPALRVPRRPASWAVMLLPAAHQDFYQELYESELWELREHGATRLHRMTYIARLVLLTPSLRRELRSARLAREHA